MDTISVIIPTYNGGRVIRRCLDSIRSQKGNGSLFTLEIIAVDDHSQDDTWEILQSNEGVLALKTPQKTGGPNAGRNIGLEASQGTYIALLDQDDAWHPDKLQRQLAQARHAPLVYCDFQIQDEKTGRVDVYGDRSGQIDFFRSDMLFRRILGWEKRARDPLPMISTLFFHRSLKHIRFEEHFGFCDFDYMLRLTHRQEAVHIRSPLVIRYVSGGNLSLDPHYRRVSYYYGLMTLEAYEDAYPREVARAVRRINGTYARYFYQIGQMKKARRFFRKGEKSLKTWAYWLTSFIGSRWVKTHFRIFGT